MEPWRGLGGWRTYLRCWPSRSRNPRKTEATTMRLAFVLRFILAAWLGSLGVVVVRAQSITIEFLNPVNPGSGTIHYSTDDQYYGFRFSYPGQDMRYAIFRPDGTLLA